MHIAMFGTCFCAPALVHRLTSKWAIVVAFVSYLIWLIANFWPHIYTLVPSSVCVGFGQTLAWSAQVSYMKGLAKTKTKENIKKPCYKETSPFSKEISRQLKFNAIFFGIFQTSHIWGNILSSIFLAGSKISLEPLKEKMINIGEGPYLATCGIYDVVDTNFTSESSLPSRYTVICGACINCTNEKMLLQISILNV